MLAFLVLSTHIYALIGTNDIVLPLRLPYEIDETTRISNAEKEVYASLHLVKGSIGGDYDLYARKDFITNEGTIEDVEKQKILQAKEISTMSKFNHPNIIKFYTWDRTDHLFFFMEWCYRDVINFMDNDQFSLHKLSVDILKALSYLHGLGYAHLDIKPDNILACLGNDEITYKLTDFGFTLKSEKSSSVVGTLGYLPPEMIEGVSRRTVSRTYNTFKADIFSFGATIGKLADILHPKMTLRNDRYICFQDHELASPLSHASSKSRILVDFVQQATKCDPKARPTINQLLKHRYISEIL